MKTKLCRLGILLILSLAAGDVPAQVYNQGIIGYVPTIFRPGNNLFNNPLENGSDTLNSLFSYKIPNGTTVSLWNSTTSSFDTTSTYSSGSWSIDLTLQPGTGALLNTPLAFTNTVIGTALDHDGSILQSEQLTTPPVFSGPNGIYLFGDKCPTVDTGTDIFLNVLGRLPNIGEQITLLDKISKTYTTSTYLGSGNWDNVPTLGLSDAAFFNIESVPEPSVLSLFCLCILFLCWRMKRLPSGFRCQTLGKRFHFFP